MTDYLVLTMSRPPEGGRSWPWVTSLIMSRPPEGGLVVCGDFLDHVAPPQGGASWLWVNSDL